MRYDGNVSTDAGVSPGFIRTDFAESITDVATKAAVKAMDDIAISPDGAWVAAAGVGGAVARDDPDALTIARQLVIGAASINPGTLVVELDDWMWEIGAVVDTLPHEVRDHSFVVAENPDGEHLTGKAACDVVDSRWRHLACRGREHETERVSPHRHREQGVLLARYAADLHEHAPCTVAGQDARTWSL